MSERNQAHRPEFNSAQLVQAEFVGHVTDKHRASRKKVKTHPIDDVEPGIVADRDDGIFVEAEPHDGGYRVHITIADVAGHVKLGSHLANSAIQRGFTVYGPGWTDPMFPKPLEERLSLEHQKERLGLMVTIDLDGAFNPVHTEWQPVTTHAENVSYQQTKDRIESDPQFALMDKIAEGVRRHYFGKDKDNRLLRELLPSETRYEAQPKKYRKSMEMVATYMLLANSCVADFFDRSELPFMYRNFNEEEGDLRARYSAEPNRHTALEKMGLRGAYCHFTSPIRRAPDFLDAHMAHFVRNALNELEEKIINQYPDKDREALHKALWDNGAEIMRLCTHVTNGNGVRNKADLDKLLMGIMQAWSGEGENVLRPSVRKWLQFLTQLEPPMTREALAEYAAHQNALIDSPQIRAIAKQAEQRERSVGKLEKIDKNTLPSMDKLRFSALLHSAALTGEMPRPLYNETLKRIKSHQFDAVQDGFSIMIAAPYPNVPRWNMLKREISRVIKHDPATVNAIYDKARIALEPANMAERHTTLPDKSGRRTPNEADHIHGAIITLESANGGPTVAPPFYSVGHDRRAAVSHARFSFIEHYAFGELQPVDRIAIPNLLYAELDSPERSKQSIVEEIAESLGATLSVSTQKQKNGFVTTALVFGGDVTSPIMLNAFEAGEQESKNVALRRLLREPTFKYMASQMDDMRSMLNPQNILKEVVTAKGGTIEIPRPVMVHHLYRAEVEVTIDGHIEVFMGDGPNMDRAIRTACVRALRSLDWEVDSQGQAESWVTEATKPQREQRFSER